MKKYIKPFILVLLNNAFLLTIEKAFKDYEQVGPIPTLIICLLWFLTFNMLTIGMAHMTLPGEDTNVDKEQIDADKKKEKQEV